MHSMDVREEAARLLKIADRLDDGEKLCANHWNGDPGWECYCTGCGRHIQDVTGMTDIQFEKDAYCLQCRKTPEEREAEKRQRELERRESDLKRLAELKAMYPDA